MINVKNIERGYEVCTSCHAEDDLKEIKVGITERQTVTLRLCKKCREEMIKELNS